MPGSFLATWTTLRRPAMIGGTYAGIAVVTALVTTLTFVFAESSTAATADGPPRPGDGQTLESLSAASGLLAGLTSAVGLFGIIALCVAAATIASGYTSGTLRNLLVRQPHRTRWLAGTWAAIVTFSVGSVVVATVVAAGVASAVAPGQGVDTDAWFTADALLDSARTVGQVALATAGYATLGTAMGVLLRASIPAVAVGIGWLFFVETLVAGTVDGAARWLPGQLLTAIASNGTAEVTLTAALLTAGGYLLLSGAVAATSFARRDVTA